MQTERPRIPHFAIVFLCIVLLPSCVQQMADQSRYEPLEGSTFFADGRSSRPLPVGTVARGQLNADSHFYDGMQGGELATTFPMMVTRTLLERGQERFNIFCSPCHDRVGNGKGTVALRGFRRMPASFHDDRLKQAPPGYLYYVISNGFGVMDNYAAQIKPDDRWAIVAYIRALQLSQDASVGDLPDGDRQELERIPR